MVRAMEWPLDDICARGIDIDRYPSLTRHLERFATELEPKPEGWIPANSNDKWPEGKGGTYAWYEIQDAVEYWPDFETQK